MKERGVSYFIDENVTFRADEIEVSHEEGRGLVYILEGEFLKDGKPFDPPMPYSIKRSIPIPYPAEVLKPIYDVLVQQRELTKKLKK